MYYKGDHRDSLYPTQIDSYHGRLLHTMNWISWKDKRVLVVGDSYGWFAQSVLADDASYVYSFDIAEPSQNILQLIDQYPGKFKHDRISVFDLEASGDYDVAGYFEVIEHLPPGTEIESLRKIASVLKPGGLVLVSTPFASFWSYLVDPAWFLGHRHYSFAKMEKILKSAGYVDIKMHRGGYFQAMREIVEMYFTKWILRRTFVSRYTHELDSEYPHASGISLFATGRKPYLNTQSP